MSGKWHMEINLNNRDEVGNVVKRFHMPRAGDKVVAYQPEDGSEFDAEVACVDYERNLVHLEIDWTTARNLVGWKVDGEG